MLDYWVHSVCRLLVSISTINQYLHVIFYSKGMRRGWEDQTWSFQRKQFLCLWITWFGTCTEYILDAKLECFADVGFVGLIRRRTRACLKIKMRSLSWVNNVRPAWLISFLQWNRPVPNARYRCTSRERFLPTLAVNQWRSREHIFTP